MSSLTSLIIIIHELRFRRISCGGRQVTKHLKRFWSAQEMTAKGSELPSKLAPIRYLAESSSSWKHRRSHTHTKKAQGVKKTEERHAGAIHQSCQMPYGDGKTCMRGSGYLDDVAAAALSASDIIRSRLGPRAGPAAARDSVVGCGCR